MFSYAVLCCYLLYSAARQKHESSVVLCMLSKTVLLDVACRLLLQLLWYRMVRSVGLLWLVGRWWLVSCCQYCGVCCVQPSEGNADLFDMSKKHRKQSMCNAPAGVHSFVRMRGLDGPHCSSTCSRVYWGLCWQSHNPCWCCLEVGPREEW